MRFNLDHDWQGNMSTPRARVGERAKTHLLLVLCALWLIMGLVGHHPWKPFESEAISIVKSFADGGSWLIPTPASDTQLSQPPLYYLSASACAYLLGSLLPMHDAARIATGLWMVITLLMMGMTGRELWGKGIGRQTAFVFIGSIGLVLSAHTLMPAVSALAGISAVFYALALAQRKPYRAGLILGVGTGVSFLSAGLLPLALIIASCAMLLMFQDWRNKAFAKALSVGFIVACPFLIIWPLLVFMSIPSQLLAWWTESLGQFDHHLHLYFLNILLWYAWPALPLALWGLWRFRAQLLNTPRFQLSLTFFVATWIVLGFGAEAKEVFALPLLIPLTAIAGGSIETLKRGAAGALNWFGIILFGIMIFAIWLGWGAMLSGNPPKIKERLVFLSGMNNLSFNMLAFAIAAAITLIWLFAVFRTRYTNRSAATNWAIGMTCVWSLLMTLWLPMIDSARSYGVVFNDLKTHLPAQFSCIASNKLGDAQTDLLYYYTGIRAIRYGDERLNCDLYLLQNEQTHPESGWELIWQARRINERGERFKLYRKNSSTTLP